MFYRSNCNFENRRKKELKGNRYPREEVEKSLDLGHTGIGKGNISQ